LDHEANAAFGFLRAWRPVRRPDFQRAVFFLELGTALADQVLQRIRGGLDAERFHLAARRPRQRLVVVLGGRQAELPRQLGIERGDRGGRAVIGLSSFFETLLRSRVLRGLLPSPLLRCAPSPLAGEGWGGG